MPAITCTGARDTVYVDATTGNNAHDGRTWATAVATLQRGLAMANECESVFTILVAKGTYTASTTSGTLAARDYSFVVGASLSIQGGFPAGGGVRNFVNNATILDGEIQDLYEAYHVMVIYGTTGGVIIDGFQIGNGFAEGTGTVELETGINMPRNVGAAMYIRDATSVSIRNCTFYTNVATAKGGVIFAQNSKVTLENCVFANNTSGNEGGAINVQTGSTLNVTNCTFNNNLSYNGDAVVYATTGCTINMKNTIIWGSSVSLGGGSTKNITYSLLQNGNMNNNCLFDNPQFTNAADPDGVDNKWFTADDGLLLKGCSPAINRGTNVIPGALSKDISNNNRKMNEQVDIGAYEVQTWPDITTASQLSLNNDAADTYFYDGTTAIAPTNSCRIIALILPYDALGSVGRIKAKTYIEPGNISFGTAPLLKRHYHLDDTDAAPNGTNTFFLYFSNAEFSNYNSRGDAIVKLPPTNAASPASNIRILHFKGNSATGTAESYGVEPAVIRPTSVEWLAAASVWKVIFTGTGGFGGFFLTAAQDYQFTGSGNWSIGPNWVDNAKPPVSLPRFSNIIVKANAQAILNGTQNIPVGSKLLVEDDASLTVVGSLEIAGDFNIDRNKVKFTSSGSFTVPENVTEINFAAWGAGGYGGGGKGGNAGFVAGFLSVTPGEVLTIEVAASTGSNMNAGFSVIKRGTDIIALAAGAGNGSGNGGKGGNGGADGQDGTTGSTGSGGAGKGATGLAGGAGGAAGSGNGVAAGTAGSSLAGGNCVLNDGDGGKGYFGGGGSGTYALLGITFTSGGGGGGSNYLDGVAVRVSYNSNVTQIIPPSPLYDNGGTGGTGSSNGTAGKVVIAW